MPPEVFLNESFGYAIEAGGFTPPEYRHKYVAAKQLEASDALHRDTLNQLHNLFDGVVAFVKRHESDETAAGETVDELKYLLEEIVL